MTYCPSHTCRPSGARSRPDVCRNHAQDATNWRRSPPETGVFWLTLVHLPVVRRLASISQLGLVNQVYPTAMHSRLEHSLGTYHNSCQFVLSLYYDPLSPLFRQIVTPRDVRLLLVSAVLHDVGQYPLAHDLEEIGDDQFDHQKIGFDLLRAETADGRDGTDLDAVLRDWAVNKNDVIDLLSANLERGLPQNLWAERRTGSPSSDPQRARVLARPRCVGLTAWTPAPRTRARPLVVLLERGVGGLRPVRGAPG